MAQETTVLPMRDALELAEGKQIRLALHATNWNRKKAAKMLGISYRSMGYKVKKYNLKASQVK